MTWRDLAHDPALADLGAHTHEGRFHRHFGAGDPVTWHTLAHHSVAVRGPRPQDITVWTDRDALARWTHRNLDDYRRVWLHRGSHLWSKPGLACLTSWGPAWGVLGVSRLHYTLATGEITSKTGAGQYACQTFDTRWWRIVDECLRIRNGGPGGSRYRSRLARRRQALDFIAMAIDDAHRIG